MKKLFLILPVSLISLLVPISIFSQTLQAEYLEGYPLFQSGTETYEIRAGEDLHLKGKVILEEGDYLELTGQGKSIRLLTPGSYSLKDIYNTRVTSPLNPSRQILNRLTMNRNSIQHETTAGVRGDKQETVTPLDFADSFEDIDSQDYQEGMTLFEAGDYTRALNSFRDGMIWEGTHYDAICLQSLLCFYQLGQEKEIQNFLLEHQIGKESPFYKEYRFFQINWLMEQLQFPEARNLLKEFTGTRNNPENRQLAHFLSGCCYYSMNDQKQAELYFSQALPGPSEQITSQSESILKTLMN